MRRLPDLAAAVLVAALVVGCGGDKGSGGGGGGTAAPASGIVGTWVYDRGTLASPSTDNAGTLEQAMKLMPKMEVEYTFFADGTFTLKEQVMSKEPSTLSGTWVLRDGRYAVTEKEKDGKPRSPTDKYNTVRMELKDGELSFNPPGAPIVFHLKRK